MLITSLSNKNVMDWTKLKQTKHQKKLKQFIIEEKLLVEEAIKANLECTIIVRQGSNLNGDYTVSDAIMRKISDNESLNDIVAVCSYYEIEPKKLDKIIYLDNVQDPGNVGTMIRSAHAFGYDQVILANNTVNKYNHKLIQAAKGSMFHISIKDELDIEKFKDKGYTVYATALDKKAKKVEDFKNLDKQIIIFGNEGSGVSLDLLKLADKKVYIEMNNFDSLNVAISAGIVLYHFRNRDEA